jgi:SAM-dependent methyltransferase
MSWNSGYIADKPYLSSFYPEQSPVHLNFSCVLNGIEPVPLDREFTYFELGFGQGLTANILAAANPQGRFYAADFNPPHVTAASELANAAQLSNLVLLENSAGELADGKVDLPQFDFITMHGVYSWVSPEIRGQIVTFLARYLKPGGIVYMSYNAMPGWASVLPLQRLMLEHQMYPGGSEVQVAHARRLVDALGKAGAQYLADNPSPMLKQQLELIAHGKLGYIGHEYMSTGWDALYHLDVARQLADAKLDFACSVLPHHAFSSLCFTPQQQALLDDVPDAGLRETLKDYIANSSFREDVFVRGARRMTPKRRMAWLRRFGLAPTVVRETAQPALKTPVGTTTDPVLFGAVLDALKQGPTSLLELAALPQFAQTGIDGLTEVAAMLISSRQAAPYLLDAATIDAGAAQRMNRVLADRAQDDDDHRALASPLLGSGIAASQTQRLVYRAVCIEGGRVDAGALGEQAWRIIDEQQRAGGDTADGGKEPAISRDRILWSVDKILTHRVPIWKALHML